MLVVSIEDLDRLLALRKEDPSLDKELNDVIEVDQFLKLAEDYGFDVTEADLFSAQQREEGSLPAQELQRRMAGEARRLRHFIQG
ncbi:MAG: Nif11-like leader peptide family natural product precursor [Prochlorococcus sp.]|jgi:predicted ribosomally synthesized peptide with nif11-like leader|nr:Nif11-like leader peptide family natural product precursor [Prochlorococcaceae cyanobacterium ETNP18_MAG_14]|tara:strand:- start:507 stop:761 length:255 start_codon:yes stop_codon:yes gene_type:complete